MARDSDAAMVDDFDTWYAELRPAMAPALAAWCGDPSLAADALDEAFTRAVERWERVRRTESPSGWVWRTATNVVRRRARRRVHEGRVLRGTATSRQPMAAATDGATIAEDVDLRRALLALTERQRTAVVLHHIADLPHRDVAEVLGIAPGTVAATLHQARQRLADLLADDTGDAATDDDVHADDDVRADDGSLPDGAQP